MKEINVTQAWDKDKVWDPDRNWTPDLPNARRALHIYAVFWLGHCFVFLGKTHYSHSASLHPGVKMGNGEFTAGGILQLTSIPSRGK